MNDDDHRTNTLERFVSVKAIVGDNAGNKFATWNSRPRRLTVRGALVMINSDNGHLVAADGHAEKETWTGRDVYKWTANPDNRQSLSSKISCCATKS
jgi:hypothetical protein